MQQRCEPLALGVAALHELLFHLGVHVRIAEYGLQIALYARHGRLQLVRYVLRELAFQYVLFLARALQTLVYLYYPFGNLAQFIVRKVNQIFRIERFVIVGTACEYLQLGDVGSQATDEMIQNDGEQYYGRQCEPYVMLVGAQRFRQIVVVGQGTPYDDILILEVCSRVEEVAFHRSAASVYCGAVSLS